MSFASRIAAFRTAGTLVVGWQPQTPADIDLLRRKDINGNFISHNDFYVADPEITLESPYALRAGWTKGSMSYPMIAYGDQGGQATFRWKEMAAAGWGSPGVNPRFGRNSTLALQWSEFYDPAFIGLCSRSDSGFMGGVKTNMIDLEQGTADPGTYFPETGLKGYTTNTMMEFVVTAGSSTPFNPSKASIGAYGQTRHTSFTPLPLPFASKPLRPGVWVVYTVQIDFGNTWSVVYHSWQSATNPAAEFYVLDDYRNDDARWTKSTAQQNAINAGDGVALKAADYSRAAPHRFRMWMQYQDWTEPSQTHDTMLTCTNPFMWGNPTSPDEAAIGQNQFSTLAYKAAYQLDTALKNVYGERYTPYLQLKRAGIDPYPDVGPFPAGYAPAATWPAFKRYDSLIVNRGAIDPKFFGGSDPEDPPPTPPASVIVPSGITVEATP